MASGERGEQPEALSRCLSEGLAEEDSSTCRIKCITLVLPPTQQFDVKRGLSSVRRWRCQLLTSGAGEKPGVGASRAKGKSMTLDDK